MGNEHFFRCLVGLSLSPAPSTGFPPNLPLGVGQSIHGGGSKKNKRRRNIFGKMGNTGGYNSGR